MNVYKSSKSPNLFLATNKNSDTENDLFKLCDDDEDDDILLENILNHVTEVQYRKPEFKDIKTGDFLLI